MFLRKDWLATTALWPLAEMSETLEAPTGAAGDPPEGEGDQPAPTEGAEAPQEGDPTPAPAPAPKKKKEWYQDRLDQMSAARRAAEERAERAEQALALLSERSDQPAGDPVPQPITLPASAKEIERQARILAATERFNETCVNIFEAGRAEFPDFQDRLADVSRAHGLTPDFVNLANETGYAHRIIYDLSENLEEVAAFMNLSPAKQAMRIANMVQKYSAETKITRAKPPIDPVRPNSVPAAKQVDPEKMSMDEWMKWREANAKRR